MSSRSIWVVGAVTLLGCPEPQADVGEETLSSETTGNPTSTTGDGDGDAGDGDGDPGDGDGDAGDGDGDGDPGDGDGDPGDGDGDPGDEGESIALFPAVDGETNEHALFYMRLDAPDPIATLDLLIEGRWVPERHSDADGRFVGLDSKQGAAPLYADFGVDPPAIYDFVLPPGEQPYTAALLDDSSAWVVQSLGTDHNNLWRFPIALDGSPEPAELLTPEVADGVGFGWPLQGDISADVSTIVVVGVDNNQANPLRVYAIDLLDPSDSPISLGSINQQHGSNSPGWFHLAADGSKLVFTQNFMLGSDVWWLDVDDPAGQQLIGYSNWREWTEDSWSGLLVEPGSNQDTAWVDLDQDELVTTPIDVVHSSARIVDETGRLLLMTNQGGGSMRVGPKQGPWPVVLGAGVNEDPILVAIPGRSDMFLVNYINQGGNFDIVLAEIVGDMVVDTTLVLGDHPGYAQWIAFDSHALVYFGSVDDHRPWVLDYADPVDSLEVLVPVSPGYDLGGMAWSRDGTRVLHRIDGEYALGDIATPGVTEPVDLGSYAPSLPAIVSPYEREYD